LDFWILGNPILLEKTTSFLGTTIYFLFGRLKLLFCRRPMAKRLLILSTVLSTGVVDAFQGGQVLVLATGHRRALPVRRVSSIERSAEAPLADGDDGRQQQKMLGGKDVERLQREQEAKVASALAGLGDGRAATQQPAAAANALKPMVGGKVDKTQLSPWENKQLVR
jgi:hypothetical protein